MIFLKTKRKKLFKKTFAVLVLLFLVFFIAFGVYVYSKIDKNLDEALFRHNGKSSVTKIFYYDYLDRENRIGQAKELTEEELFLHRNEWVSVYDMPEHLKNAFIAVEDKRFYEHNGVDWLRSTKAILNYFLKFDKQGYGGSTITQQLIKNVTGENEVSASRKLKEIFRALSIEKRLSKNEILEAYLNVVYMSQNSYGVSSASKLYFNKEVGELSLAESATLASIVQNPLKYDPYKNYENNGDRRKVVLLKMLEQKMISREEYEKAINENVVISEDVQKNKTSGTYSWYTETLINDISEELSKKYDIKKDAAKKLIIKGGFNIYSVIDPYLQKTLEDVYTTYNAYIDNLNGAFPESACVIIDPKTSDLLAIVGGTGKKTENLIYNRATMAKRPVGSVIKPLSVYSPGIEEGIFNYSTVYDDVPMETGKGTYWPKNSPDKYRGLVPLCYALEHSINTVAVKALRDIGIDTAIEYLNRYGISVNDEDKNESSLALGQLTYGESLLKITNAYCPFANGGIISNHKTYLEVTDSQGRIILKNENDSKRVISKESAYIVTMMLKRVVESGTASNLNSKDYISIAAKTGTSSNNEDKWVIGYTPYYVCGVWTGFDTPKNMNYSYNPSVKIFDVVMERAHANLDLTLDFEKPIGVIEAEFCFDSGKTPKIDCQADERGDRTEIGYYLYGTEPSEYCDKHEMVTIETESGRIVKGFTPFWKRRKVSLLNYNRSKFDEVDILDEKYLISNRIN